VNAGKGRAKCGLVGSSLRVSDFFNVFKIET
jgi:hypothetical protein